MTIDLARKHIVILNGGSGCIIQPMTDEYLYVLTAKHNIIKNNNQITSLIRFSFDNNTWSKVDIPTNDFIKDETYFLHPDKDVAIIKIPPVAGFDGAYRFDNINEEKNDYNLLGYPEIRRKGQTNDFEWYRRDPGVQILDPRGNGMYEAQIPGNVTLNEVRGDSGGAILKIVGDKIYLAGIQNKMAEEEEQLGRVRFNSIASFDEIVTLYPQHLKPILPSYFASFSFLRDDAFNLTFGLITQAKAERLTKILKTKATELAESGLIPVDIKNYIKSNLSNFHKQECYDTYQKKVWVLWLELLTVLNIAKQRLHQIDDLPSILKKVRFFYSNTDKDFWVTHLRDLHRRDYSGLDEDAIVVVASNVEAKDGYHKIDFSIPENISLIKEVKEEFELERMGMKTTIAIDFPLHKYRFLNISAFKEGTMQNIDDSFLANDFGICINTIRELYEQLVPNW